MAMRIKRRTLAEVLAIIRQVRETPPPFPEKTEAQIAARAELGVDRV